ncbi:PREDICTED: pumilio homolog 15-like [Tarenaya hassleriana]|uniref:pumilio homolog 15-like n=1 Tax=Tarenaya hassleriana TaxID=28532 RepID=UPI00053C5320|nr:PREDICTED: pumilio homolog 15-like [Tarenaya hassleriana]
MSGHLLNSLMLSLILAALFMNVTDVAGLFEKERVEIKNKLRYNKILKLHCKSRDDDLGVHLIPPWGTYEIVFHDNLFYRTLFWCNLWQGPHYKHHQAFAVYDSNRGIVPKKGNKIVWEVIEYGILEYIDETHKELWYRWDLPHGEASSPLTYVDEDLSPR